MLEEKIKCDYTAKAITYDKEKVSPTNEISKKLKKKLLEL